MTYVVITLGKNLGFLKRSVTFLGPSETLKGDGGPNQCLNEAKFGNLERKVP